MSTAFLKTMFSSSSPLPTANTWSEAPITRNFVGLVNITSVAYGNSVYVATGVGGYNSGYPTFFVQKSIKYTSNYSISWSDVTTNLDYINFTRVRFLNGKFLAVGFDGSGNAYVCESTDGNTWVKRTVFTGASGYDYPVDIAWSGSFYVIGRSGSTSVYRSSDLITWTTYTLSSSNFIDCITYGAGLFVAPAGKYYAWTSPDGATWTLRTINLSNPSVYDFNDIVYANSQFVSCGGSRAAVSSDGITWTLNAVASTSATFYAILYQYSKYIIVGGGTSTASIDTSSDGITWAAQTLSPLPSTSRAITYDGTQVLVLGNSGSTITTTNATSWSVTSVSLGALNCSTVGYSLSFYGSGNSLFVVCGNAPGSGQNATILYSYDALSWATGTISGTLFGQNLINIFSVVYSNGEFITNTGLRSSDGITWTTTSSYINTAGCLISTSVTNLLYASRGHSTSSSDNNIYKSTNNGVTWTIDYVNGSSNVGQMAFGAGITVALSPNTNQVLVNPNLGAGWYSYSLTLNTSASIIYASGKFYVISSSGGNYNYSTSVDGTSWTTGVISLNTGVIGTSTVRISYRNGLYVMAISGDGTNATRIATSINGINYTVTTTIIAAPTTYTFSSVVSNPTTFIATSNYLTASTEQIYFSTS